MPTDRFGVPYFYPSKKTAGITGKGSGFFWEQNNDITKDDDYDGTAMVRIAKEHDSSDYKVINSTTGEWQFPFTYAYDYSDGLSLSGPTGHHSGGETHGCEGYTYMIDSEGFDSGNPQFRFRKETYHVQYDVDPQTKAWSNPFATGPVANNWKGYGWVRYNRKDGISPGKDSVVLEAWWNDDPVADITNWKMIGRTEDKGAGISNWGVPATCDGPAYAVGTWSNIQFRFKSSGSDFSLHPLKPEFDSGPNIHSIGEADMSFSQSAARGYGYRADMPRDIEMKCLFKWNGGGQGICRFKNVSLREIDPTLSFDDNPDTPPPTEEPTGTSTVTGFFKFQQDINTIRGQSACAGTGTGGGAGSGNSIFYSIPYFETRGAPNAEHSTELSNSSTFQNRTRVVQICKTSASPFNNKLVKQMDILLKKVGSPTTPNIQAKIWTSFGRVEYTSPTNLDPSTLTTDWAYYTFDFSTNTHELVPGNRIGIEWTGTSTSAYPLCGYEDGVGPTTIYANYESGVWEEKQSRDLAFDLWD